jgi:hypothetical protein
MSKRAKVFEPIQLLICLLWSSVFSITMKFPLYPLVTMALLLLGFSLIHKTALFSSFALWFECIPTWAYNEIMFFATYHLKCSCQQQANKLQLFLLRGQDLLYSVCVF